jgi:hypothetical protein
MRVTGSLAKPTFTPDAESIAQMKLKSLLPTASDPTKLSNSILGILGGGQQQQSDQTKKQQPSTTDAVQSIFDAINGAKKKK